MIDSNRIQRPKLVLVVDDHEINRDVLELILEDYYDIVFAENGKEALRIMQEREKDLSIVLLDLMMPIMSGFEVLEFVKNDEQLKRIPIIVLTAEKSAELEALQLGASDFITKPFDTPEIILARVGRVIELSEGRQLISSAEHDRLTMLYTRNFFFEYAERLYKYHPETHMDAISMNIEQFHSINALKGRKFGDDVLKCLGNEIRAFLSETEGIGGRFESDRFDIYCEHQDDYNALLERFQAKLDETSPDVSIHLRMGVKQWQEDIEPVLLFDQARAACNMARGNYQNPLMIYDEDMRERELLNQHLISDLRRAIDEKQFTVFYQPKYDIQSNPPKLASAEALVRWIHPELGMVSPGDFIPLFEGNGLIGVVDSFVWNEASQQVATWRAKYGFTIPVSVNISRSDVFDPMLHEKLKKLIEDNGLQYEDIKLEVTESAYTDNSMQVIGVVERLQNQGFHIEMDDFGSGYSSLNMLSHMPIDVLKVDMKFVRNIEENETDLKLVQLIMDIAKYLELTVVAEGVETEGQLLLLQDAGCNLVQGFYFSRPLPPEEFELLIQKEIGMERK